MRILQVRFGNLNSLVGEWEIDFTHADYAAGGIFAITGPTGAGKSTILDAICLALYGSTPRLGGISQSANDIMSRQTGECFAEVSFETASGRYKCHWGQHRARRRAAGQLQPPRHEISELDSGRILESSRRGVSAQIEAVTGMDFDRFTRSMLLAQGGFAAFLQAPPDERGPVLEQITGTEIYSRISIAVHEHRSKARAHLDVLNAELAGMQLLDDEKVAALEEARDRLALQAQALEQGIAAQDGVIGWFDELARVEQELAQTQAQYAALAARIEAFAPRRTELARAMAALELEAAHARLEGLRQAGRQDGMALEQARTLLVGQQARAQEAGELAGKAGEALLAARSVHDSALPTLRQAAQLDVQLGEAALRVSEAAQAQEQARTRQAALAQEGEATRLSLATKTQAREAITRWQAEHAADGKLPARLAGIESELQRLQELARQSRTRAQAVDTAQAQLQQAQRRCDTAAQSQRQFDEALAALLAKLDAARQNLDVLLQGRPLALWRDDAQALTEAHGLLERLVAAQASLGEALARADDESGRLPKLAGQVETLQAQLEAQIQIREGLEREEGNLQTQWAMAQRIAALEDRRAELRPGEPCPLCGSLDHPWEDGSGVPTADETSRQLDAARAALREASDDVAARKIALESLHTEARQAGVNRDRAQAEAKARHDAFLQLARRVASMTGAPDAPARLAAAGASLAALAAASQDEARQAAPSALVEDVLMLPLFFVALSTEVRPRF